MKSSLGIVVFRMVDGLLILGAAGLANMVQDCVLNFRVT